MTYREIEVHPALSPFVDRLWTSDGPSPEPRVILPDGCIDLLFDRARGQALVVGTMTRAATLAPSSDARFVAVRFRPGGAYPFLGVPADELTDQVLDAREGGARWLDTGVLEDLPSSDGAARALERCLLARLARIAPPEPIVAHAAGVLFAPDPPTIASLGTSTGWSRQHLTRMFRRHVGVGPKTFARVARLQRAVHELQRPRRAEHLAAAAAGLGYFDQAHMARDFRELVGMTPSAVGAATRSIFPIPSLLSGAYRRA